MWDTVQTTEADGACLSHDMPCPRCGHEAHTFLVCGDACSCEPTRMPGSALHGTAVSA